MKLQRLDCENFHRRDFLQIGSLSMMGLGLSSILAREAQASEDQIRSKPVKNVIMIWLAGGPSALDMWDMKPEADQSIRGEFRPMDTSADGVQICEHLPSMAGVMDRCTLIRSVHHTIAEHGLGTQYVTTGNRINPALSYPSIGSVVSHLKQPVVGVPTYVDLSQSIYGKAGFLGASYNPVSVDGFQQGSRAAVRSGFELADGVSVEDLTRKSRLLERLDSGFRRFDQTARADNLSKFQQQAIDILRTGKTRDALDLSKEDQRVHARYGGGSLGRSALASRRLIQAGVRFVTIGLSGWDTHARMFPTLRNNLLPTLDRALSALISDLDEHGLLDETIVYCTGEFSRTPVVNPGGGRDHWARSMSMLMAGGHFHRGRAYGSTDRHGAEPKDLPCSPMDVNATVLSQLGIQPTDILRTGSGRPIEVFRNGNVIDGLIA